MAGDSDIQIRFGADTAALDAALSRLSPQFAALGRAVAAAGAAAPSATAQLTSMTRQVDQAATEATRAQLEAARRSAALRESIDLEAVKAAQRSGQLSVEAARDTELQIVQAHADAEIANLTRAETSAAGELATEAALAAEIEALRSRSADQVTRIDAQAAEEVAAQWTRVNREIGQDFASTLLNGLTGRGGIAGALKRLADRLLSGVASDVGDALAGHAESALGLGGQSPGAVLSGAANSLGIGGITSWLGLTKDAAGTAGDAAKDAALTANTAALGTLNASLAGHAATLGLNTGATTVNTGAATVQTGAVAAQTGATTANTAGLFDGVAAWIENTASTIANTIATDAASVAHFFGFADGGSPPVGVPSLIGERGPELWVPNTAGMIYPNAMLGRLAANGNTRTNWTVRQIQDPVSSAQSAIGPASPKASQGSGDTHLHYSPTVNAPEAPSLGHMLTAEASTMRRWLRNELRNGTLG
jgi:hypothetical protein